MGRNRKSITERRVGVIATRLDVELLKRLDEFAKKNDVSRAQLLRGALKEFLDRRVKVAA